MCSRYSSARGRVFAIAFWSLFPMSNWTGLVGLSAEIVDDAARLCRRRKGPWPQHNLRGTPSWRTLGETFFFAGATRGVLGGQVPRLTLDCRWAFRRPRCSACEGWRHYRRYAVVRQLKSRPTWRCALVAVSSSRPGSQDLEAVFSSSCTLGQRRVERGVSFSLPKQNFRTHTETPHNLFRALLRLVCKKTTFRVDQRILQSQYENTAPFPNSSNVCARFESLHANSCVECCPSVVVVVGSWPPKIMWLSIIRPTFVVNHWLHGKRSIALAGNSFLEAVRLSYARKKD